MSTSLTITTVSLRRQLNHHHYSPLSISPSSSSSATGQYITAQDSRLLHWRYDDYTDRNFRIHGQTLLYLFILFSIILLAALLLLYARWFFRLRHLPTGHTLSLPQLIIPVSRPTTTTTTSAAPHPSQQKNGLDRVEIDGIPIVLYQTSDYHQGKNNEMMMIDDGYSDLECCICLGMFEDGDKVKVLPGCSHRYHCDCIDLWLCGHSSCPLCRLPVHVDPPV